MPIISLIRRNSTNSWQIGPQYMPFSKNYTRAEVIKIINYILQQMVIKPRILL
ncbi:hypothetical protein BMS_1973 [Halobacteriovorax marinus SJ]|uniref:Uncharacterized protein n=1 Tax=Halobacteriovorax marinus (strain ATCC BAA-682 / DSM 15412 / SJ) TaxID=862908 RepID=E1X2M1_HALMS|nr:hypothetical protein BMS_1973 [Halobacteriovorax marinus SJ]